MVAYPFVPMNWARCEGQLMPVNSHLALFSLLGAMYGGNGLTTFALPDLRGRAPMHASWEIPVGARPGREAVSLNVSEIPYHSHAHSLKGVLARALSPDPAVGPPAVTDGDSYGRAPAVAMDPNAVTAVGGGSPHDNMQPYLGINFIICVMGVYPSRN